MQGLTVTSTRWIEQVPVLEFVVSNCISSLKVLFLIPKGAVIHVEGALQNLLSKILKQHSQIAWGRLVSFCYLCIQYPSKEQHGQKSKQQVTNFMEFKRHPNLPPLQRKHLTDLMPRWIQSSQTAILEVPWPPCPVGS